MKALVSTASSVHATRTCRTHESKHEAGSAQEVLVDTVAENMVLML